MIVSQILTVAAIRASRWSFSTLWNSLTFLQAASALSAAVLMFGAVIEYWGQLRTLILLTGKWIVRKSTAFDRCVFRKLFWHSIGPILVVFGIAGEVIFGGQTFIVEDKQTAETEARTASLEVQAEQLKRANLELEEVIQPRDLTVEEQNQLHDDLRPFRGRTISLRSYAVDTEAERLGKLLKSIFEEAGLTVVDNLGNLMNFAGNVVDGVQIVGPHSQDDLIQSLLNSPLTNDPRLRMFRKDDPRIPSNALVEILVGVKPISPAVSQKLEKIEQLTLALGPRGPLVEKAAPELIKRLSAFPKQNVDFFIWRENSSVYDRDAVDTWGAIANVVGTEGAKWNIGHGGFRYFDTHLSVQGVIVFVNSRAPKETMEAAKALSDGLTKALPPSANKVLVPVNPDLVLPLIARGVWDKEDPEALVAQDSTLMAVLIGENTHKIAKAAKK